MVGCGLLQATGDTEVLIQGYSAYLQSLGKSKHTVSAYTSDVRLWAQWFKRPVEYFREDEWDDWVAYLQSLKQTGETITRKRTSLKRFYKYLRRRKIVAHDPSEGSEAVGRIKSIPEVLEPHEVDLLLSSVKSVRMAAILEVLYDCGIRSEELRTLTVHQIQGNHLRINGKGSKQRVVAMVPRCVQALELWLKERPATTDLVFPSKEGKQMSSSRLREPIQTLARQCGITKSIGPHTFRHSIATHLAIRGVPVERIQLFLGHESPETTMKYIHLAQSIVQDAILKAHPRS